MAGKPLNDRIAETEKRIRQLQAQKQALLQAAQQRERKERTRRLIQIGATMAHLGMDTLEKAQAFQRQVEGQPRLRAWLHQVMNQPVSAPEAPQEAREEGQRKGAQD